MRISANALIQFRDMSADWIAETAVSCFLLEKNGQDGEDFAYASNPKIGLVAHRGWRSIGIVA